MTEIDELRARAEAGSAPAMVVLGVTLLEDRPDGTKPTAADCEESFRWFTAAAARGVPRGKFNLAKSYAEGVGTGKDLAKARELFSELIDRGDFPSLIEMAELERNHGDMAAAARWYQRAMDRADEVGPCEEIDEAAAFLTGRAAG